MVKSSLELEDLVHVPDSPHPPFLSYVTLDRLLNTSESHLALIDKMKIIL